MDRLGYLEPLPEKRLAIAMQCCSVGWQAATIIKAPIISGEGPGGMVANEPFQRSSLLSRTHLRKDEMV